MEGSIFKARSYLWKVPDVRADVIREDPRFKQGMKAYKETAVNGCLVQALWLPIVVSKEMKPSLLPLHVPKSFSTPRTDLGPSTVPQPPSSSPECHMTKP